MGFEPTNGFYPIAVLVVQCIRPLYQPSVIILYHINLSLSQDLFKFLMYSFHDRSEFDQYKIE